MKVTVTEAVRCEALMQALGALNIPVGGRLFHNDLAASWREETGLRQKDLRQSLSETAERGGLTFTQGEHDILIELTSTIGQALHAPLGPLSRMQAAWVLRKTRRRQHLLAASASTGSPLRREADHVFGA
jgi:hypothetical protein